MAILKCKMCGGDIELSADRTFGTCEFCGSTMTFPKVNDEQRANAFNRGNLFRRSGEFDKALAVYERIVQEDENDAEAHWCCALCRFGIEYVEDPNTFEYLPTCHRASFDSFLEDVDYLAALEHSDGITKRQYQKDAAKIAEVQRGILATSQNEEPFDVFICYKETEDDGRRTRDSLFAQDIYYQLTEQGRRVFFSRITLEDKTGTEYEPYIFAALNSAKVMVLVTTSAEHANAVWVKNEWSRFLSLMRKDRSKLLLPCYRDMDPYDLPEALSVLQSYDMGKIGFIQDLIRGVNKVLDANKPKETVKDTVIVQQQTNTNVAPLLKRAFMFLEDGEYDRADEFCEQVLNLDPENAEAYLGKLMAELKVRKREALKDQPEPFDDRNNYQKVMRFGDEKLKAKLSGAIAHIRERNETARKEKNYQDALSLMHAQTESKYREAQILFDSIPGYKDAVEKSAECKEKIETARKETIFQKATATAREQTEQAYRKAAELLASIPDYKDAAQKSAKYAEKAESAHKDAVYLKAIQLSTNRSVDGLMEAVRQFESIAGWKDADERCAACQRKIEEIKLREETKRQKRTHKAAGEPIAAKKKGKKALPIVLGAVGVIAVLAVVFVCFVLPKIWDTVQSKTETQNHQFTKEYWDEHAVRNTIAAGEYHSVAVCEDGTVVSAGASGLGKCDVSDWVDIIAVAAGQNHTVGLKSDGTVIATEYNIYKQCDVNDWTDIVAIEAGGDHTVGLKADGTVIATGTNTFGQCMVADWTDIIAIAAGNDHTVGLKENGTVIAVGSNSEGQCNVSEWTNIVAIATGSCHTVGVKADGTVVAAGESQDLQLKTISEWSDIVAVSAGNMHTVGLKSNGTCIALGETKYGKCNVSDWTNIVAIAAGGDHTLGLKADGTVVAVGNNYSDQQKVETWKDIKLPRIDTFEMATISDQDYDAAIALYNAGKYEEAIEAFHALNGYKDSEAKIKEIKPKYHKELLSKADVGASVFFGRYEQDNNASNGKEDIEWIVLAKNGSQALLISKYALDGQQYDPAFDANVTWETCSLRKWLNETFIRNAFSSDEQAMIRKTTVTADENPSYSTSPGNNTTDKVFLLSITEVNKYFSSDSARQCQGTAYYAQGADGSGKCCWWLRSPGHRSDRAACVDDGGFVITYGSYVQYGNYAVRPALWIDLGS